MTKYRTSRHVLVHTAAVAADSEFRPGQRWRGRTAYYQTLSADASSTERRHDLFGKIAKHFALGIGRRQKKHFMNTGLLHRADLCDYFLGLPDDAGSSDCFGGYVLALIWLQESAMAPMDLPEAGFFGTPSAKVKLLAI
jgi:hypothetical protein